MLNMAQAMVLLSHFRYKVVARKAWMEYVGWILF